MGRKSSVRLDFIISPSHPDAHVIYHNLYNKRIAHGGHGTRHQRRRRRPGGGEGGGGRGRRKRRITGAVSDETAPPQRKYTPSIAPIGATEGVTRPPTRGGGERREASGGERRGEGWEERGCCCCCRRRRPRMKSANDVEVLGAQVGGRGVSPVARATAAHTSAPPCPQQRVVAVAVEPRAAA